MPIKYEQLSWDNIKTDLLVLNTGAGFSINGQYAYITKVDSNRTFDVVFCDGVKPHLNNQYLRHPASWFIVPTVLCTKENWKKGRKVICVYPSYIDFRYQMATVDNDYVSSYNDLEVKWISTKAAATHSSWSDFSSFVMIDELNQAVVPMELPVSTKPFIEVAKPAEPAFDWDAYNGIKKYSKKY